jgi:hypothetical protein
MEKKKLPKSIRKFIRREKARIRREILGIKEQERLIQEIYQKIFKNQRQSAIAASSKQDTKDKQPAAPRAEGERISVNQR